MSFYNTIRLQTLFWEIKNRFFYILFSFALSFAIAYKKSKILLYLFVLPYTINNQNSCFCYLILEKIKLSKEDKIFTLLNDDYQNLIPTQLQIFDSNHNYFSYLQENCYSLYSNNFLANLKESSLIHFSSIVNSIDISSIRFIFTDVEEAFSSQILICLIFSFISIFPLLTYNILSFFLPSLYFHESKKWIYRLFLFLSIWYFFVSNVQNKIIPKLAEFLLQFQINSSAFNVVAETKIYSYCNWAYTIFLVTNAIFILICLISFLITNETVKIDYFTKRRKLCKVLLFLISALIAPPDLYIQLALTLLLTLCFELLIFIFFLYKNLSRKFK